MPTSDEMPKRHLQFSLAWLLVAIVIAACFLGLWVADPPGIAIVITMCLSFVLPPCAITAAFCSRGYTRSFFIGMGVLQFFQLTFNFFVFWIFAINLDYGFETFWEFMLLARNELDLPEMHRFLLVLFFFSLVSGLLSIGVHWLLRNQVPSN